MPNKRKLVELLIDEDQDLFGVLAISLVKAPAIEENFIFLNKANNYTLAKIDEEKQLLYGAALIPNKKIMRFDEETNTEYDVYFSNDTVKKASELFLMQNKANEHTIEHTDKIEGVTVVESWIVEDTKKDKSNLYGFNFNRGTWVVGVKVNNTEIWDKIKTGDLKGFSIEGYFTDKLVAMQQLDVKLDAICPLCEEVDKVTLGKIKSLIMENEITPVAELDNEPLFNTKEEAELYAVLYKTCNGSHKHVINGVTFYMACTEHSQAVAENYTEVKGKKRKKRKRGYMKYAEALEFGRKQALASYPWAECIRDQKKRYGSEETAAKVCAAIKNRTVRR
tara:strand:- start:916 stop:1923 length:1008 start_codon:yes stop_codon:yes gene_type:complete